MNKPILHKKTFQELTTDELYELLRVRSEVFVVEQNCVYQDMDGDDQKSIHLWLTLGNRIVALARVYPAGTHMKEIGATHIDIEAQEYAKEFYERVGFKQSSDSFMLDGIPHIKMTWTRKR